MNRIIKITPPTAETFNYPLHIRCLTNSNCPTMKIKIDSFLPTKQSQGVLIANIADRDQVGFVHLGHNFGNLHNMTRLLPTLDRAAHDKFLFRLSVGEVGLNK
jgi:hypothetical protein